MLEISALCCNLPDPERKSIMPSCIFVDLKVKFHFHCLTQSCFLSQSSHPNLAILSLHHQLVLLSKLFSHHWQRHAIPRAIHCTGVFTTVTTLRCRRVPDPGTSMEKKLPTFVPLPEGSQNPLQIASESIDVSWMPSDQKGPLRAIVGSRT